MRIVRDVPHPNNFDECVTLMASRVHLRKFSPLYLPITDALCLLRTSPDSYAVLNEGIPFITFNRNGTALINSCGVLEGHTPGSPLHPLQDTLHTRLNNCLNGTNWALSVPNRDTPFRLLVMLADLTPLYYPFKDLSIIKLGTTQIWQPSPTTHLVTNFSTVPPTPAATPTDPNSIFTTPFNPDPRLRHATLEVRGPSSGDPMPPGQRRFWVGITPLPSHVVPTPPTHIVLPNGQFAPRTGMLESYHWNTEAAANSFIGIIREHFRTHPENAPTPTSPTTTTSTSTPSPFIPRSPLITSDTTFSVRGPVLATYPHPYWISVHNPEVSFNVLRPTGVVSSDISSLDLYAWDTADDAHAFIMSLLNQEPRLTCTIHMPPRRTP